MKLKRILGYLLVFIPIFFPVMWTAYDLGLLTAGKVLIGGTLLVGAMIVGVELIMRDDE